MTVNSFKGYKHIPIEGIACSPQCAENKLDNLKHLDPYNEDKPYRVPVYHNSLERMCIIFCI